MTKRKIGKSPALGAPYGETCTGRFKATGLLPQMQEPKRVSRKGKEIPLFEVDYTKIEQRILSDVSPRTLVFCGTRNAIERYDMLPDWAIIVAAYPPEQRQKILNEWLAVPGAKLAVDRGLLHGWRCPADTLLLFDPSWPFGPGSPEWVQATARRARG